MPEQIQVNFRDYGSLYVKGVLKILAILFFTIEFIPGIGPIGNWWIVLGVLLFNYFQFPVRYYSDQPYKAIEAWARMVAGLFIAIFLLIALTPDIGGVEVYQWFVFGGVIGASLIIAFLFSVALTRTGGIISFISIALIMYFIVMPYLGQGLPQAAPIFFLTLAFFFVAPERGDRSGQTGEKFIGPGPFGG